MSWPPPLTTQQKSSLISHIKDYQLTHGSLLALIKPNSNLNSDPNTEHTTTTSSSTTFQAHPVGTTLFPTPFPSSLFKKALELHSTYQNLYRAISKNENKGWLYGTLAEMIENDDLVGALWSIYEEVEKEKEKEREDEGGGRGCEQEIEMSIWRSDYMLHGTCKGEDGDGDQGGDDGEGIQLKQVEFNTFSCAGGVHGNKVSDMHRYLYQAGAYPISQSQLTTPESSYTRDQKVQRQPKITPASFPTNNTIATLAKGLATAYRAYKPRTTHKTCILTIVQPHNFNTADERPIEYALHTLNPPIPNFRLEFPIIKKHTSISSPTKALLYQNPDNNTCYEVSVIYYRAGYEESEYDENGYEGRLQLERSRAIKCPSLLSHLSTFKRVQQALTMPDVLERFVTPDDAAQIRETFAPMYPMDESEVGLKGRALAMDRETAVRYVLKPSLEGGGHNVYGIDIPGFLKNVPEWEWSRFVLMEKIEPPVLESILMSQRGLYEGSVVSELGVFGVGVWRLDGVMDEDLVAGSGVTWSFKTKDRSVDEMSVVKGYGCFDSPLLLDNEDFVVYCGKDSRRPA